MATGCRAVLEGLQQARGEFLDRVEGLPIQSRTSACGWREAMTGGDAHLAEVTIGSNESFEQALKRFNKMVQQTGILAEVRRRSHYESPSIRRKKKAAAKRRKNARGG